MTDRIAPNDGGGAGVDGSTFVVLAGGDSRRMGRPKAFLDVGGREMLDRVLEVGRSACAEVVLVAGEDPAPVTDALLRYGWEEDGSGGGPAGPGARFRSGDVALRLVRDRRPGLGPVAGLAAGLAAARGPSCFAAACDLPLLAPPLVDDLLSRLDALRTGRHAARDPGLAVVPLARGRRQPLAAAYTSAAAIAARRCMEAGALSMDDFLARLDEVREVAAGDLDASLPGAGHDPERLLLNVNRPEELRAARRAVGEVDARAEHRAGAPDGAEGEP